MNEIITIGYGGHSYVALEIFALNGFKLHGYIDGNEKETNPYNLNYMGNDSFFNEPHISNKFIYFISIGNSFVREKLYSSFHHKVKFISAIHPSAIISSSSLLDDLIFVAAGVCINPMVKIGKGSICNTNSSIDHECNIGAFSHIAPGAVLCGNVTVGNHSIIGAGAIIKEGIKIGNNVIVGAGAVVVNDIIDNSKVVGCPAKQIIYR